MNYYTPVLQYRTDDDGSYYPMITDLPVAVLPETQKQEVLKYLSNKDFQAILIGGTEPLIDAFTGEKIREVRNDFMRDGKWSWRLELLIYVRDHDVALPKEFLDDVKAFFENGNETIPVEDKRLSDLTYKYTTEEQIREVLTRKRELLMQGKDEEAQQFLDDFHKQKLEEHSEYKKYCDVTKKMD